MDEAGLLLPAREARGIDAGAEDAITSADGGPESKHGGRPE
jgi:hypothetical protein